MNSSDRCDRCGAQAYVKVLFKDSDLLFCGHHFAFHEEALAVSGIVTEDTRQELSSVG